MKPKKGKPKEKETKPKEKEAKDTKPKEEKKTEGWSMKRKPEFFLQLVLRFL